MQTRKALLATLFASLILAVLGALPAAFDVRDGLSVSAWVVGGGMVLTAVLCLQVSWQAHGPLGLSVWTVAVATVWIVALAPHVVESIMHREQGDLGLAATALAIAFACGGQGVLARTMLVLFTAIACGAEATAILWAVGFAWFWSRTSGQYRIGAVVLAAGVIGLVAGRWLGLPMLAGHGFYGAAPAIHRDLMVLSPVIMLGTVGLFSRTTARHRPDDQPAWWRWMPGVAGVALAGLLPLLVGVPINVRICILPFWWLMPIGLHELAGTLRAADKVSVAARAVACLSCAVLVGLSIPGAQRLLHGPLMAVYLLMP